VEPGRLDCFITSESGGLPADIPGWTDPDGNDCAHYAREGWCCKAEAGPHCNAQYFNRSLGQVDDTDGCQGSCAGFRSSLSKSQGIPTLNTAQQNISAAVLQFSQSAGAPTPQWDANALMRTLLVTTSVFVLHGDPARPVFPIRLDVQHSDILIRYLSFRNQVSLASNVGEQGSGTALHIDRSNVTVLGCLFHSLEAELQGGAIYVKSAQLDVYDCTFLNCKGA
jgi:hypothetical protein